MNLVECYGACKVSDFKVKNASQKWSQTSLKSILALHTMKKLTENSNMTFWGWRTLVESEFSWKLFSKMGVFQWKFSEDEFPWTFFTNFHGHFLSTRIHPSKGIFVDIFVHENSPKNVPREFTKTISTRIHPKCPREYTLVKLGDIGILVET